MSSPLCKRVHHQLAPGVPLATPPLNWGVARSGRRRRRQKAHRLDPATARAPCLIYSHLWEILHWIVPAGKTTLMLPVQCRWWSLVITWVSMELMEAAIPTCKSLFVQTLLTIKLSCLMKVMGSCLLSHNIRCKSVDTPSLASQSVRRKGWLSCKSKCKFFLSIRRNPHTRVNESHC
jgi:hypothetical protein